MTILGIILAFLPGFAWLFFYLREDPHPEPKRLIFLVFLAGALSAIAAFVLEIILNNQVVKLGITSLSFFPMLILALIEEVSKFGGAYFIIRKNPDFDEPIDAMIYMVVAALGFATVENVGVLIGQHNPTIAALAPTISTMLETASFRFVGATLLHTLTSAILGYYWAIAIRDFNDRKYLFFGVAMATVLHAIFNQLIIAYGNLIYPVVFLIVIGIFTLGDFEKLKWKKV
jgi:RsiW-degrading membrane proteinase PrsW (M82 family)